MSLVKMYPDYSNHSTPISHLLTWNRRIAPASTE
uniref:Uncharacterized protein n=1 Tax=Arundo donax TaxID=35708 RepID=A0A0A9FUQ9_ARUDO